MTQQLIIKSYEASRDAFVAENVEMGRNPRPSKEISNRYYYLFQISIAANDLEEALSIGKDALDYVPYKSLDIARKVKTMSNKIGIIMAELSKSVSFDAIESVVFLDEDISPEWDILLSKADKRRAASEAPYLAALVVDAGGTAYCRDPEAETAFKVYSALPHCIQRLQSADYHLRMAELRCLPKEDLTVIRSLIYACANEALE